MKSIRIAIGLLLLGAFGYGVFVLVLHPEWVKGGADDDDDKAEVMPVVPVRLGKVARATVRRFVPAFGTVEPAPAEAGFPAAVARVASPVPGVIAQTLTFQGQAVEKGAALFQLDDRAARAEEEKGVAALASQKASLEKLKAFPRPDQVRVAEMQVDRAKKGVEFSAKKKERVVKLLAEQLASEKTLQEADQELLLSENDLAIAERQLAILRASPTPEEVAEAQGKVVEAEKALAGARIQRSLLRIESPLAGTVVRVRVNPGEAVDLTTELAEVVDLGRLVVEGTLPAAELRSVKPGQEVEIDSGIRGKVLRAGLEVDRKSDSGLVRVSLPPASGLALGQAVRLRIVVEEHRDRLVVPHDCVVRTPEGKTVIVGFLGEKAIQKEVKVGLREGDLVEIEGEEIDEGDAVVTEGAYGLPGEAKIRDTGKK
jgi:membrane fusion protein (multidrug efflux system)